METTLKDEMESKILHSVKINNVPIKFWEEFKRDAELNFSNNYIMKIMVDHSRRISGDERVDSILSRLKDIEEVLYEITERQEEQPETKEETRKIKVFGGRRE